MAQKTEKEETEFKVVPETLSLCVNNCGFTGNPATNNMCQKCFNAVTATTTVSTTTSGSASNVAVSSKSSVGVVGGGAIMKFSSQKTSRSRSIDRSSDAAVTSGVCKPTDRGGNEATVAMEKRVVNRCSGCRRKVGLTGFRCRCGELFCGEHRYSDRHDCSYDYKSAGRDAIARENPVVKAAKIVRV